MTPKLTCEEARELAPEMALGTISGDERARLIEHIASCGQCRELVEDLARVADSILLLGPEHEPPGGFESAVLARMRGPRRTRLRWLAVAAALVLAAASAGSVLWVTADEREVAAHYQAALEEAHGEYFGVKPLTTVEGTKVGNVFTYEGHPSWLFVTFEDAVGSYRAELIVRSEGASDLGTFTLDGDDGTWGSAVDAHLKNVVALRFVSDSGETLEARFPSPD